MSHLLCCGLWPHPTKEDTHKIVNEAEVQEKNKEQVILKGGAERALEDMQKILDNATGLAAEIQKQPAELELYVGYLLDDLANLEAQLKEAQGRVNASDECVICFVELEGHPQQVIMSNPCTPQKLPTLEKRAVLFPCMHATVCVQCAQMLWIKKPQKCPTCLKPLTRKPSRILCGSGEAANQRGN